MNSCSLNLIVNQLPIARHKALLRWLANSLYGRKLYHKAVFSCLKSCVNFAESSKNLDRKTKISFMLLNEFGHIVKRKKVYPSLVNKVDLHISRKEGH